MTQIIAHLVNCLVIDSDDGFDEVQQRYESLVPATDFAELTEVINTGNLAKVQQYTDEHAPHSFLNFWTLILINAIVKWTASADFPWAYSPEQMQAQLDYLEQSWGSGWSGEMTVTWTLADSSIQTSPRSLSRPVYAVRLPTWRRGLGRGFGNAVPTAVRKPLRRTSNATPYAAHCMYTTPN